MDRESGGVPRLGDEEQLLWEHVEMLWELARRRETAPVRKLLHPDYTGWVTGLDRPHDYQMAVASVGPGSPRILRYRLQPLQVTVFDHEVGVVHYRYEAEVEAAGGESRAVAGRWTEVYKRRGRSWLMISASGGPDGMR